MRKKKSEQKTGPVIISRQEHGISRKQMSPNALRVLYRLRDNGHVAYLVGGCVRDLLLGREPKDFDVATDATPNEVKKIFRNCRLIGRRFRLAHVVFQEEIIEVATFRSQATNEPELPVEEALEGEERTRPVRMLKDEEGMILRDNVFGTPEEDAVRRDFTVNALSYNIADFSIIDFAGGLPDLNAGIIRTIGDPAVRFQEDPVRMLRAVRFAAQLGFTIEEETLKALVGAAETIVRAAPPRLYEEVLKLLLSGEGAKCCQLLRQTGLFAALFPAFSSWMDSETNGFPHARFGQMLDHVDTQVQQGEKVSPPLLFALLFGEYIEEKAENFHRQGAPWQTAMHLAIGNFLEEVCPIVMVTNRVGLALREILAQQNRLRKIPGRRPQNFVARPDFGDIVAYCRLTRGHIKETPKQLAWWAAQAEGQPTPPPDDLVQEGDAPRRKKRRRRRRRKPGGGEPAE